MTLNPSLYVSFSFFSLFFFFASFQCAYAKTDVKKYIPEAYRHYIPDIANLDKDDFDILDDESSDDGDEDFPDSETSYGPVSYSNKKLENLKVYGPTTLKNVTVEQKIDVHGPLVSKNIKTKSLDVLGPVKVNKMQAENIEITGPAIIKNSEISGNSNINGPLIGKDSHFKGNLSISAHKIKLIDSEAASIFIKKNSKSDHKKQILYLAGKTVINKDISFEREGGLVVVDKSATLKGKIKGGQIKLNAE